MHAETFDTSVLITYHDEGSMLCECLESLLGQTPRPREIIVWDDASEQTPARDVVREANVQVVESRANTGPAVARNRLLEMATSTYVHFHDADDWFEPAWCRNVSAALSGDPDVVMTDVASQQEKLVSTAGLGISGTGPADLLHRAIAGSLLVPSSTVRASLARQIGGFDEALRQSEDYDYYIRLFAIAQRTVMIREPLVRIRLHPGSRSLNRRQVYIDGLRALEKNVPSLPESTQSVVADSAARMASSAYRAGATREARAGFRLARQQGGSRFPSFRRSYAWIATWFGQETAERFAAVFRSLRLPSPRS